MLSSHAASLEQMSKMYVLAALLATLCLTVLRSARLRRACNDILSYCIHIYLCWLYPVRHEISGAVIPTCQYRWPNGQGDTAKFLNGLANSKEWDQEHGSIYRIWSGMTPEIVLTTPTQLKTVFKDSDKHRKAVDNNSGYLMSQVLGQCLGLISGRDWQALRSITEPFFMHASSAAYVEMIHISTKDFIHRLTGPRTDFNGMLDPIEDLKMLPFLTVAAILYGRLPDSMINELLRMAPYRESLFKHVIAGGVSRFKAARLLPTRANTELARFRHDWARFNHLAYEYAISVKDSQSPIVKLFEAARDDQTQMENVLQTLDEMLFANLDVTAGALSWNLIFLANHSSVQDRLRDEICKAQDIDTYIRSSKTYLAACINESARLKPLAAFSVPQSAPTDRALNGYTIPAGTNFVIDAYALNMRNDFWGSDTTQYRPDRWTSIDRQDTRYHYWRFGFGPRQCLGRYVADMMMRTLIVQILRRFELKQYDDVAVADVKRDDTVWIDQPMTKLRLEKLSEGI